MQGVVKSYDPGSGDGLIVRDSDLVEFELADGALEGSIFIAGAGIQWLRDKLFFFACFNIFEIFS